MEIHRINQKDLDSSCWLIQFQGKIACKTCQANNTADCGGQTGNAKLIKQGKMDIEAKPKQ